MGVVNLLDWISYMNLKERETIWAEVWALYSLCAWCASKPVKSTVLTFPLCRGLSRLLSFLNLIFTQLIILRDYLCRLSHTQSKEYVGMADVSRHDVQWPFSLRLLFSGAMRWACQEPGVLSLKRTRPYLLHPVQWLNLNRAIHKLNKHG